MDTRTVSDLLGFVVLVFVFVFLAVQLAGGVEDLTSSLISSGVGPGLDIEIRMQPVR